MATTKCEICFLGYDLSSRRPRCLNCGHSFCTSCLYKLVDDATLTCPTCRKVHNINDVNDIPINFSIEAMISTIEENEDNEETAKCKDSSSVEAEIDINILVKTKETKYDELCIKHNSEILFYCLTHNCGICKECTVDDHSKAHCTVITSEEEITDTKLHHEDELNTEIRKCAEFITSLQKKKADIETEEMRHESLAHLLCQERDIVLGILGQAQGNKRRMGACKRTISLSESREEVEVSCASSCDVVADMKQWQQEQEERIMNMTTEDTVLLELERRLEEEKSLRERECRKLVEERDITSVKLLEVENLRKTNQQKLEELIEQRRQDEQHTKEKDDKVIKGFALLMIICLFSLWFTFITDKNDNSDISFLKSQLHESMSKLNESLQQQDNLQKELVLAQVATVASDPSCDMKEQELLGQKMRQLNGVIFERNDIREKLKIESKAKNLLEIELQEVRKQHGNNQKHLDIALAHQDMMEQKLVIAESRKDYIELALRETKKQRDELQREVDKLNQRKPGESHSGNEETKNNWGFSGVFDQMKENINDWTKKTKFEKEKEKTGSNENQKKSHNIFDIIKDIISSVHSCLHIIFQLTGSIFVICFETFSKIWNIIIGN